MKTCFLGAYVPVTMEGNILIDGVLASCYPSVHHDILHIGMTPMRWFPYTTEWIFGVDNGFPTYVYTAGGLGIWIMPDEQVYFGN